MDESLFTSEAVRGSAALRRFARSWARDEDDLDDLIQSAWQQAWEKRSSYRGDGDFVGWLVAIGRTVCVRDRKRRRLLRTEPLPETLVDAALPDHVSERRAHACDQRDDELLNIIVRLPDRQRAVVLSHLGFGRTVKEVAESIGRSPETVKATLAQARRSLRKVADELRRGGGG